MVAQIFPRWNPLTSWMRQIEDFQRAEIQHLHAPVARDHDIGGLQIAMDEAFVVRRGDSFG